MSDPGHAAGGTPPGKRIEGRRCARAARPPSRLVVPGRGRGAIRSSSGNASRSFGRAAAVFDLITSSTSGQLDRDTADRLRPRAPPPVAPRSRREAPPGMTSQRSRWYRESSGDQRRSRAVLSCRCSVLDTPTPTPSHRREHVSAASAQVNGVIVASVVGKIDEIHNLDIDTPTSDVGARNGRQCRIAPSRSRSARASAAALVTAQPIT